MSEEQINETEPEEKQQHIPYRYENAKENEYQPKQFKNSIEVSESGGDIMKKINEEADNLESIIDKNDLKIFSKYEDLNEEQLKKLLEEKNENILKINKQKEDSKTTLSNLLKKLNKTITDNTDILYKEQPDPEIIFYLEKEIESRKKELKLVKNMNHSCKSQYNAMSNKLNQKNKNKIDKDNGEIKIHNLKNENKKLQVDIRKYKDEDINKKKDVKKIVDNKEIPYEFKIKSDEIRNLTNQKHECYTKMTMCIKSLENIKQEINHLEEISKNKYKENNSNLNNKINFWLDIIKSDLNGNQEELIKKIENNKTNFLKEINKNENNLINDRVKSSSFDENMKQNNLEISYNLKLQKEKNKIGNNLKSKGIFGKYNYLKTKPYSSMKHKYKLSKISISSEEKKIDKISDINIIIEKDYENTTDSDYRQLLDKKSQYLETNMRLEKNIKEIERTKKTKLLSISYTIQENEKRLKELKLQNELLEQEIVNLQNLYQLTIDKERLKKEINTNKKIIIEESNKERQKLSPIKLETSLATENVILNELKESKDKSNIKELTKRMNKNRSGYTDDFIPDKSVIETREQRLKKIREKYLNEDENENQGKEENNSNILENKNEEEINIKNEEKNENPEENNEEKNVNNEENSENNEEKKENNIKEDENNDNIKINNNEEFENN